MYTQGIGCLINFLIGIREVVCIKNKQDRDYIRHKAAMYFSLYWLLPSQLSTLVAIIIQHMKRNTCEVGYVGLLLVTAPVITFEFVVYRSLGVLYTKYYCDKSFYRPIVKYNHIAFAICLVVYWMGSIAIALYGSENDDVSCYSDGIF